MDKLYGHLFRGYGWLNLFRASSRHTYIAVRSYNEWVSYWESLGPRIGQTATIAPASVPLQPHEGNSKVFFLCSLSAHRRPGSPWFF
jgi:hypothetical protein